MKRISEKEVKSAYLKTGLGLTQYLMVNSKKTKACGLGAIGLSRKLKLDEIFDTLTKEYSKDYIMGFIHGFDEKPCGMERKMHKQEIKVGRKTYLIESVANRLDMICGYVDGYLAYKYMTEKYNKNNGRGQPFIDEVHSNEKEFSNKEKPSNINISVSNKLIGIHKCTR